MGGTSSATHSHCSSAPYSRQIAPALLGHAAIGLQVLLGTGTHESVDVGHERSPVSIRSFVSAAFPSPSRGRARVGGTKHAVR